MTQSTPVASQLTPVLEEDLQQIFQCLQSKMVSNDDDVHKNISFLCAVPRGPPQDFVVSVTSCTLTLSWSPPLLSQRRNGVIISYLVSCTVGGNSKNMRVTTTSKIISIKPFTSYTCSVSAATIVGDGPPATVSGTSDEDGEYIIHYSYCDITHDVLYSPCRTTSSVLWYC